jgi:hypothetical protein
MIISPKQTADSGACVEESHYLLEGISDEEDRAVQTGNRWAELRNRKRMKRKFDIKKQMKDKQFSCTSIT